MKFMRGAVVAALLCLAVGAMVDVAEAAQTGMASYYKHGKRTANGERYDPHGYTAAHRTIPFGTRVLVTNLKNGKSVIVRINDRGPYAHDRIIDLSRRSARALGFEHQGVTQVRVRFAGSAPLDGNDARERQHLAAQPWAGEDAIAATSPRRGGAWPMRSSLGASALEIAPALVDETPPALR